MHSSPILRLGPTLLKIAVAQGVAFFLLLALALLQHRFIPPLPFWLWPIIQAALALAIAKAMGLQKGWLWLQTVLPCMLFYHLEHTNRWLYPALLTPLLLIYGGGLFTRVPLYNSNRHAWQALLSLLEGSDKRFLDLGAGLGGPLKFLARHRTDWRFEGVESSPLVFVLAWVRTLACPSCQIQLKSIWSKHLGDFDIIFAFLSPVPMPALWEKACREMRPGAILVSHTFEIPGIAPERRIPLKGRQDACLLVYRPPETKPIDQGGQPGIKPSCPMSKETPGV